LKIDELIQHVTVKSPETVEVNTLGVCGPASESGYVLLLKKTNGGWIIDAAAMWLADKMPPEPPPGN
jgi:hypothetical protein